MLPTKMKSVPGVSVSIRHGYMSIDAHNYHRFHIRPIEGNGLIEPSNWKMPDLRFVGVKIRHV
jgi:hypothetical protein